ncbi:MAG TPA: hypothetical protein VGH02_05270 [Rhizomicrobium sp.]
MKLAARFRKPVGRFAPVLFLFIAATTAATASDAQIRQAVIRESLASYPGNCPCPYNVDRAGRSCGRRSAYSRPGGYAPICYESDVTPQMIDDYRARHGQ